MNYKFRFLAYLLSAIFAVSCGNKESKAKPDTILTGKVMVLVDATIAPIIADQAQIFENTYKAKITVTPMSENQLLQAFQKDSSRVAVLTRKLTEQEGVFFTNKKINTKQTKFATDAIVLISNKKSSDTLIAIQDVINFMLQKPSKIKGLVFDNPNSSTARYFNDLAGISDFPKTGVYSFKTNEEAIKYVSENDGMIGIVGLNWVSDPTSATKSLLDNINILSVKGQNKSEYVYPSQNNIAEKRYPLARDLYIINSQGYSGLGMGFSSFITNEIGQRIILKSGLVPITMPGRRIVIRNGEEKKQNNK